MTGRAVPRVRIPLEALEPLLVELRDVLRAALEAHYQCWVELPESLAVRMAEALERLEAVLVEVDG